jgi:hypothetical protein
MDNIEINLDTEKNDKANIKGKPQAMPASDIKANIEPDQPKPASTLDKLDIRKSSHPMVCIFHLLFKLLALVG